MNEISRSYLPARVVASSAAAAGGVTKHAESSTTVYSVCDTKGHCCAGKRNKSDAQRCTQVALPDNTRSGISEILYILQENRLNAFKGNYYKLWEKSFVLFIRMQVRLFCLSAQSIPTVYYRQTCKYKVSAIPRVLLYLPLGEKDRQEGYFHCCNIE